jgi:hypothetical protein
MSFYVLGDNTFSERRWTTAVSIHPRSHVVRWACPDCGRAETYPAGSFDATIEGGAAYPDILLCGAFPLLIVSESVVSSWNQNGIGPIVTYPVGIAAAINTELSVEESPQYFRVEVVGEAKVDIPASGGDVTEFCVRCGGFRTEPMLIRRKALLEGSWDGSPLFRDHCFYPSVIFCTDVVKKLAESENHTNFRFNELLPSVVAAEDAN